MGSLIRATLLTLNKNVMGKAKRCPEKEDIINEYFYLCIYELENGEITIEEANAILKILEEKELYLECKGVYEAIQMYTTRIESE